MHLGRLRRLLYCRQMAKAPRCVRDGEGDARDTPIRSTETKPGIGDGRR